MSKIAKHIFKKSDSLIVLVVRNFRTTDSTLKEYLTVQKEYLRRKFGNSELSVQYPTIEKIIKG